jgi:hypothetical protein
MAEILRIGKAFYKVDYRTKTYRYYGRNPERASIEEEDRNKRKIDGFVRIFRDKRTQKFRYTKSSPK